MRFHFKGATRSGGLEVGFLLGVAALLGQAVGAIGSPVISEFLASNRGGLRDEDGETSDWIELHNPDPVPVQLEGWTLTDTRTELAKWRFPAVELPAGGYRVVFASGKNRGIPGAPLHTNFKLDAEGEFLALVAPGGLEVVSGFSPAFRPQFPGVSFGISDSTAVTLLPSDAPVRVHVPSSGVLGESWRHPAFDDSGWIAGTGGVGFETSPADYSGLLGTDVGPEMSGRTGSCFVRFNVDVDNRDELTGLQIEAQYDDGFVAWLNGVEVARRSAPAPLVWNSLATADHPDALAVVPQALDPAAAASALVSGRNVLAVQILNVRVDSSDLLFRVQMGASRRSAQQSDAYFPVPTPGEPNLGGVGAPGPVVGPVERTPAHPTPATDIRVTARVEPSQSPVSGVTLNTRVMFGPETAQPMFDDGRHGDGAAGDRVYGALIPAGTAGAGQMLRYRIVATDSTGQETRLPLQFDPVDSEEYFGVVLPGPDTGTRLPVFQLFVENVGASESFGGTRASLSHLGEFYDNIGIRLHGQSSSGFPKKSFNLDFNRDHRFQYATNAPRVKDLKLLTNYGDKSRLHTTLAYELIRDSGSAGHFSFPVRVERNGVFHGVLDAVEDADNRFLERAGLNPDGALYKVYDALESPFSSEKKTRRDEGVGDLQALIDGLAPSRPLAQRVAYAWDNLDLPQVVSYFVGLALVSSQDHGHKNFFVYRDSTGSGDWSPLPWDVDLTFGRNWTDAGGYFTDTIYTNNVLNFYNASQQGKPANRLYSLIFQHPEFRGMYLRRLRTAMDEVLQAPGTPVADRRIEARIGELLDLLDPPGVTPSDADQDETQWGTWGARRTTRAEAQRILDLYLPGRRNWLFHSASAVVSGERIPEAQPEIAQVRLDGLEFHPASQRQAEEYVRLTNAEPFAVDISGWTLRGEIRHTFRPGTVIPPGRTLHVARDVAAFRDRTVSPRRGEGVFVQGNFDGQLSARGGRVELRDVAGGVVSVLAYAGDPTPAQRQLRLSELMFHPVEPLPGSPFLPGDFEFLELKNVGLTPLNLTGARFTEGVTFAFTNAATAVLAPGARTLIVSRRPAFEARYGNGLPVAGEFSGSLANEGETLRLEDATGEVVFEFRYDERWVPDADGAGASLEPAGPESDLESPLGWKSSGRSGGTPGTTPWLAIRESVVRSGDPLGFRFLVEGGVRYFLEERPDLNPGSWTVRGDVSPEPSDRSVELSVPIDSSSGFLRVRPASSAARP